MSWEVLSAVDPTWGDLAQLGVIALAMIVGAVGTNIGVVIPLRKQLEREQKLREEAEADGRTVRDALIREIVPATTLQAERSAKLLEGLQQVVGLVEKVMATAMGQR